MSSTPAGQLSKIEHVVIAAERALTRTYCRSIVIIGAGFCGAMLAAHLLRHPPRAALRITLVEKGPEFARGAAYAAHEFPYLLNVPASRMSAEGDDPQQFLEFVRRRLTPRGESAGGGDFFPRSVYGDYLQSLLDQSERAAPPHIELARVHGEAVRLAPQPNDEIRIDLASGTALFADDVVIATGNPPSAVLPGAEFLRDHPAYIASPWRLPPERSAWRNVAIVGTGLSMADAFLQLSNQPSPPRIHAISRHGLVPLTQSDFPTTAVRGAAEQLLDSVDSARGLMRVVRGLVHTADHLGGDWRRVANLLRTLAPEIWRALPLAERRRFARHIQPYWDVHRHRLPPAVAERMAHAQRIGQLHVHAGRIQALQPHGRRLTVGWRRRGGAADELSVDAVINATGPDYRLHATRNPLLKSLHADGLIAADPLSLGIETTEHYAVIGSSGMPAANIFYLGPMLRAAHWEATAVAELRDHTARLAALLATRQLQRSIR